MARANGLTPPTMEQPQYNLFERDTVERDYLPVYELGLGTTIWSPLASGLLTGKYNGGIPNDARANLAGYEWLRDAFTSEAGRAKIEKARALASVAEAAGLSLTNMALLWCLKNPRVSTVILGASRISQLTDNLGALAQKALLTEAVVAEIEAIVANQPALPQRF